MWSAVCQPSVPVLAAVARMEAEDDPYVPLSMTLMGGPIDTRENPTVVNTLAEERGIEWFRRHVITKVPFPHPGFMRDVYPGFLQLNGFMTMNLDRHIEAHRNLFRHLVEGDGDSATKHREFYDEYLAVMDLSAEFYLQTVETVFIRHDLPKGRMTHRGKPVDPSRRSSRVALLTIEGEHDDISGVGQTQAAHKLCIEHSGRQEGALPAAGRRPLRRVQRLALPLRDRAAHLRLRPVAQRTPQGRQAQAAGRSLSLSAPAFAGSVDVNPRSREQRRGGGARRVRHLRIAAHDRGRDRAVDQQHQLGREAVRIVHVEPHQQRAKPGAPRVLEGDRDPVRRMPGLLQLGDRIHERAAAEAVIRERALEPLEIAQNLLGRRLVGQRHRLEAARQIGRRSARPSTDNNCTACAC